MASFPYCSIPRGHTKGLEKKGFLPPMEITEWRLEKDGGLPELRDDEVVVLVSFYECDFGLPLHPFCWGCSCTMG